MVESRSKTTTEDVLVAASEIYAKFDDETEPDSTPPGFGDH